MGSIHVYEKRCINTMVPRYLAITEGYCPRVDCAEIVHRIVEDATKDIICAVIGVSFDSHAPSSVASH